MRTLLKMEEVNKKNGLKIEDQLSKEEINLLKDAQQLKKLGKL